MPEFCRKARAPASMSEWRRPDSNEKIMTVKLAWSGCSWHSVLECWQNLKGKLEWKEKLEKRTMRISRRLEQRFGLEQWLEHGWTVEGFRPSSDLKTKFMFGFDPADCHGCCWVYSFPHWGRNMQWREQWGQGCLCTSGLADFSLCGLFFQPLGKSIVATASFTVVFLLILIHAQKGAKFAVNQKDFDSGVC